MKNDSLVVQSGTEGIVINTQKFSRRMSLSEEERKRFEKDLKEAEGEGNKQIAEKFGEMIADMTAVPRRVLRRESFTAARKWRCDWPTQCTVVAAVRTSSIQ